MGNPSACFVTLDSIHEGVGRSQIVPVVREISQRGWDCTLVHFEKPHSLGLSDDVRILPSNVKSVRLDFGRRGSVGGAARLRRLASSLPSADVYHCRDLLAFTAASLVRKSPLIWDCRSLWVEQRADAGTLRRGGASFRALNLLEKSASRRAAGLVTLTDAAALQLRRQWGAVPSARRVIPTTADLKHFTFEPMPYLGRITGCLSGSFGRNYDLSIAENFMILLKGVPGPWDAVDLMWTSGIESTALDGWPPLKGVTIRSTDYSELPAVLSGTHFGLVPIRFDTGVSSKGMMPTKVGEFWASGRPIVVTSGVGDLDELIESHGVGVSLRSASTADLLRGARELVDLLQDPDLARRCRSVAERYFDLSKGVSDLIDLYMEVAV